MLRLALPAEEPERAHDDAGVPEQARLERGVRDAEVFLILLEQGPAFADRPAPVPDELIIVGVRVSRAAPDDKGPSRPSVPGRGLRDIGIEPFLDPLTADKIEHGSGKPVTVRRRALEQGFEVGGSV